MLDLSHAYRPGMFASAALPPPCFELQRENPNVTGISLPVHTGTHVDCPRHFFADGPAIDELPLCRFRGQAICAAVRRGPNEEIAAGDLEPALRGLGSARILLVSTGWAECFDDPARYAQHPFLSTDAAQLVLEFGVELIGLDIPTPDMPEAIRGAGFDWPVHRTLLGEGVLIVENLTGLARLAGARFRFAALPLAIAGADGSPVRAVAE